MQITIVGLGNPGKEYENTRHNAGRIIVQKFAKAQEAELVERKATLGIVADGKLGKEKYTLLLPETFMNNSGKSVMKVVKSKKAAEEMLVVRDDLDLPVGTMKITFARGSGGHKGVESIARALKTKEFAQLKIGVSPATPKGKTKKVHGEEKVLKFVVGKFSPAEEQTLKKVYKKAGEVLEAFVTEGLEKATMIANTK